MNEKRNASYMREFDIAKYSSSRYGEHDSKNRHRRTGNAHPKTANSSNSSYARQRQTSAQCSAWRDDCRTLLTQNRTQSRKQNNRIGSSSI